MAGSDIRTYSSGRASGVGGVCLQVSCLVVPACIASRRARVFQLLYTINNTPSHSNLLYKATVIIIIWFDWRDRAEMYELRTGKIRWWEKLWDDILFCKTHFRSNLPWLRIVLIQPIPFALVSMTAGTYYNPGIRVLFKPFFNKPYIEDGVMISSLNNVGA